MVAYREEGEGKAIDMSKSRTLGRRLVVELDT
jgi:hypothetical protein